MVHNAGKNIPAKNPEQLIQIDGDALLLLGKRNEADILSGCIIQDIQVVAVGHLHIQQAEQVAVVRQYDTVFPFKEFEDRERGLVLVYGVKARYRISYTLFYYGVNRIL